MFEHAELKIGRANKHISEFQSEVLRYIKENPHSAIAKFNAYFGCDVLHLYAPNQRIPEELALPIGDAIHNVCTALDFMWYEFVCLFAKPSSFTKFPWADTEVGIRNHLTQRKIPDQFKEVGEFILNVIKPYQGSDTEMWEFHNLDITDKHEYLIPRLGMISVWDIRAEAEDGAALSLPPQRVVIPGWPPSQYRFLGHRNVKITDQGHMTVHVLFAHGPFEGRPILETLDHFMNFSSQILIGLRTLVSAVPL